MKSRLARLRWWLFTVGVFVSIWGVAGCAPQAIPIDVQGEPTQEAISAQPETEPVATSAETDQTAAEAQELYQGIPVGFTEQGYPYRGSPDAPVVVFEYSDYQCPFCSRHVTQTEPALDENFVRTGQVKFVFRDFPLESLHPNAIPAAIAAQCVADQGAVAFWEMHDRLFHTQSEWAGLDDPTDYFAQLAQESNIDMEQYNACVAAGDKSDSVAQSLADGQAIGFTGTPSFQFVRETDGATFTLVGAQPYDVFDNWISTIVDGGTPVDPQEAQRQRQEQQAGQIPFWATADGLKPDPERAGYTVAGDEYRGNPDAKVVIVEFSDFECPYCRQHTLQTQPILDEQFVDTGKIMWVYKHFPLQSIHPHATTAGVAAECAADQGKFWEMHDLLFSSTDKWANNDMEAGLTSLAEELGLDMDAFTACLQSEENLARVESDMADGASFVRGTPTFVILFNNEGRLVPGALPADQFVDALNQVLETVEGQ